MFGGLFLGIFLGLIGGLDKPKAKWWKILLLILVTLSLMFTIFPPIAGNWSDIVLLKKGMYKKLDVRVNVIADSQIFNEVNKEWQFRVTSEGENFENDTIFFKGSELPNEINSNKELVVILSYDDSYDKIYYESTHAIAPLIIYPFIPSLYERVKILNLHVPLAWIAVIAYLFSMIYSIRFLRGRKFNFDVKASSTASIGTIFAILATLTGMLWAKYNWGSYWNWDPRQVSILILILIYGAYFALRSAIENPDAKARLSSAYSIIAFITVPFLVFIIPRMFSGLHPGSADDTNSGPVVSTQENALDSNLAYSFGFALFAFTVLFFWILNIKVRQSELKRQLNEKEL